MINMSVILENNLKSSQLQDSVSAGIFRPYLSKLGGIVVKGLTLEPREGNKPPRIAETPAGILNSVGLQNPGVEYFIKKELPFLREFDTAVIANIAGSTVEEYCIIAEKLGSLVDGIELNISCPNVKERRCSIWCKCRIGVYYNRKVKRAM